MDQADIMLLAVMALSIFLQFYAAIIAIRLIRPSGAISAWIILACGFTLQWIRRMISLLHVLNGQLQGDMTVEVLGLAISLLMLYGILKFKPLFDDINRTHNTLLEQQEKQAKANHELESFVSIVSHDLRSPLTVIIGFSEFLRENPNNSFDKESLEGLQMIESQGARMLEMMEDLLALAKVGYIERSVEPIDVNKVIEDILDEFAFELTHKKVTVNIGDLPDLHVPETLLTEVFRNLIGNALFYACTDGSSVDVWGEREQSVVRFYVRDHGPGIPENERLRIFELFYRGSTGKACKGTGIGLAIVHKIVQLYQGRIWVAETPLGGSTFCLEVKDS